MELYTEEKWSLEKKGSRKEAAAAAASAAESRTRAVAGQSFTRRCARLVKEQRARFYIMRRCITMLVCWRDLA